MTDKPAKSWSQRLRSFAALPLPFLLMILAILAAPMVAGEPAFVYGWSVEAKALALFAGLIALFVGPPLLLDVWSKWIDPTGYGAHERKPLSNLIDNIGTHATIAAVLAFAVYGKQLMHISFGWILISFFAVGFLPVLAKMLWEMKRGDRS